jgi:hypothetical protein
MPRRSLDTQIRTTTSLRPRMGLPPALSVPHLPMGHAACPRAFARPPHPMHTCLRCCRAPPPSSPQCAWTLRSSCTRFLPPTYLPSPRRAPRCTRAPRATILPTAPLHNHTGVHTPACSRACPHPCTCSTNVVTTTPRQSQLRDRHGVVVTTHHRRMHLTLVLALPRPRLYTPGPRSQHWRGDNNNIVTTHPHHCAHFACALVSPHPRSHTLPLATPTWWPSPHALTVVRTPSPLPSHSQHRRGDDDTTHPHRHTHLHAHPAPALVSPHPRSHAPPLTTPMWWPSLTLAVMYTCWPLLLAPYGPPGMPPSPPRATPWPSLHIRKLPNTVTSQHIYFENGHMFLVLFLCFLPRFHIICM